MSLVTIMSELLRFVKDNLVKIVIGAVIFAIALAGGRYYLGKKAFNEHREAYQQLKEVYAQEPAEFQFVITNEDGTLFGNSFVLDEYFSQPNVVKQVEQVAGVSFELTLTNEQALELYKTPQYRGGLAAIRNLSSDVITLRILVAPTAEENLKVAQTYKAYIESGEVPFLIGKKVTFLNEPAIGEKLNLEVVTSVAMPESLNLYAGPNTKSLVVYGVLGLIAGTLAVTAVLFVIQLSKKTIRYGFDYAWELNHVHIMYREEQSEVSLDELVQTPAKSNRLIVAQQAIVSLESVSQLSDATDEPSEIVVLIQSNITTKEWYQAQMVLAQLYRAPLKIIHII